MQSATSYALASLVVVAIAGTFAEYSGLAGMGHGGGGGSIFGAFIISSLLSIVPALFAFVLFRAGAAVSKRCSDPGSAFGVGIVFAAGASILAIGVGLSMHSLGLAACLLVILNCVFAYSAPFTIGRRTANASSALDYESIVPESISKKSGVVSFSLFLVTLIGTALATLTAFTVGGGGHPPGGVVLLMFAALGVFVLAPIGVVLGFLGRPHRNGNAMVGLLGNLFLLFLALWFKSHI